jgi:rhamnose utilization protein RhaD (predicted bifunctional aldolase and dehydrogenase)
MIMDNHIQELVDISRFYGKQKEYVIAGGGNTSFKNEQQLYIKASGTSLADISEDGFCILDREKLARIPERLFSDDPVAREEEVKNALLDSLVNPASGLRPSVETSLHNLFNYRFVVHTHPTVVNALMCSINAETETVRLFGAKVLYIPYSDPGFILFTIIRDRILGFRQLHGQDPQVVFIQNHGVFVASDSTDEIMGIYTGIIARIKRCFKELPDITPLEVPALITGVIPAVRMLFSDQRLKLARGFSNKLVRSLSADSETITRITTPFTPDQMVYCLSEILFIEHNDDVDAIVGEIRDKAELFSVRKGVFPKVIFVRDTGVIVVDDSAVALDYLHDLVLDFCQIAVLAENFGGRHPMSSEQITFIENWEVENYRKKVSLGSKGRGRLDNKVVVITGAAQGFGAGIAEMLYGEGASVVVADLNEEKGRAFAGMLNSGNNMNRAAFVSVNVAESDSVSRMIEETVPLRRC